MLIFVIFHLALAFLTVHTSQNLRCISCNDCDNISDLNFITCDTNNLTTIPTTSRSKSKLLYKNFEIDNNLENNFGCYVSKYLRHCSFLK